jgi:hypothetical protein
VGKTKYPRKYEQLTLEGINQPEQGMCTDEGQTYTDDDDSISVPAFLLSHWWIFSSGRLSEHFSGSQTAFGTTFRITGGYRKARTSLMKRVNGGFS